MLDSKVVVALDFDKKNDALSFVDKISPTDCKLKVGKEMFTQFGPEFVKQLTGKGFDVFLDLKFHDIPNTVAKAVTAAADLGVWMVNVHASGGIQMMTKAKEALVNYGNDSPLLIGVTAVYYTHLTLPTNNSAQITWVAVSSKKNKSKILIDNHPSHNQ